MPNRLALTYNAILIAALAMVAEPNTAWSASAIEYNFIATSIVLTLPAPSPPVKKETASPSQQDRAPSTIARTRNKMR
jgi:hypothetical protein